MNQRHSRGVDDGTSPAGVPAGLGTTGNPSPANATPQRWHDVPPWVARDNDRKEAMRRINTVAAAFLAGGMKWTKAIDAILTEIDGQANRGGRVGEAHIPEIRS